MANRTCALILATVVAVAAAATGARAQCCVASSGCFCDLGGTIKDTCTGLQWEMKNGSDGIHNAANLHDVDNGYAWVGLCTVGGALCQPNAAAAAACAAHADAGTTGCSTCASGTCNVDVFGGGSVITTVWDWLSQVNAANFAGHNDWRLPSEAGCNSCYTVGPDYRNRCCTPAELETILLASPCGTYPCINSIFGPTGSYPYSSASIATQPSEQLVWGVNYVPSYLGPGLYSKFWLFSVRAVR